MKKILSMFLALAMVFSLAVPAMAAEGDTYTLHIDIGQVVDSTKEVSGVWLWANDGSSNLVNNEQISYVSGTVYSYSVPSAITGGRFSISYTDGSSSNSGYYFSIESAGKNLYTPTGEYTGTWSTYGSTGGITGNTTDDVSASYTPVITITDIALSDFEGNGSVTVDEENKTYTINIPADADSTTVTVTVSGQNLDKASEDYQVKIFKDAGLTFEPGYAEYDSNTGNVYFYLYVVKTQVGSALQYSTDGGQTWTDTGWSTVVRKKYNVTVNAAENGTVTASPTAAEGDTVELFVTADEGYELDTLSVMQGDTPVEVAEDHTFTMPAGHVTVTATFKAAEKAYNITINESENGTVVAKVGEQQVTSAHHNDDVTLVVTPAEGYQLSSLTVKDASNNDVTVTDSNTFVMPERDVTVTATFKKVYNVETFPAGSGIVTVDKTSAAEGETVTVTFTANDGYALFDRYAYDPNNSSDYVELTPGTDVNTFTFVMPAHAVQVVGNFAKDGKAREDLYFNNGGNTAWTDVMAYFYTDAGSYINSVLLTMEENGVYTLPEGTEIPNLTYKVYFYNWGNRTEIADIPTGNENMFTLSTTTNMDGQYEGSWSVYTPSQPPAGTTSAEISWGSMAFTYTDGENGADGAWTADAAEGAGTVTVKNTGDNTFTAQPVYTAEADYDEIVAKFYHSEDPESPITMGSALDSDETVTFILKLFNKPEKAITAGTKIGTVTIRITEGTFE